MNNFTIIKMFELFTGFEANCEVLLQKGSDVSYTYWIDPDGPSAIDAEDTGIIYYKVA